MRYDVAVVGAGPAGASAAIWLARRGLRVALLDKATFPRRKACGEGLFPRGVRELKSLGVLPQLASRHQLKGIEFRGYGQRARAPLGSDSDIALGVERLELDGILVDAAFSAGVELVGETVTSLSELEDRYAGVIAGTHIFEARAFIGADGLNSRLNRFTRGDLWPERARYGISAHVEIEGAAGHDVSVWFDGGGEVYLTPTGPKTVNVAYLTRRAGMSRFAGDVRGGFEDFIRGHPALPADVRLTDAPLAAGPFPSRTRTIWHHNLVFAGDAAGFYDGITGEGMSLALIGGRLCAAAVCAYLESGDEGAFRRYERALRELARPSEILARLSLFLAGHPMLAKAAIRNLGRRPATFRRLIALNAGEAGFASVRPADILALGFGL